MMFLLWLISVFVVLLPTSNAKSLYVDPVNDGELFTQEYKSKFVKNRNILNKLQGDIVLTDEQWDIIIDNARQDLEDRRKNVSVHGYHRRFGILSDPASRWTFPIKIYITPGMNVASIMTAVKKYEDETCVRFDRVLNEIKSKDGIIFWMDPNKKSSCFSSLGKVHIKYQPQKINLGFGCDKVGTVWHEIAHALGVDHEQSRSDRDKYIVINSNNIDPNSINNFYKNPANGILDYGIEYDYGSLMHYGPYDFALNRKQRTMVTWDPRYYETIGQRAGPSFLDVKGINLAYCSSTCSKTLKCRNGGYVNPSNCNVCNCPPGFKGQLCGRLVAPMKYCGERNQTATNQLQTISATGERTCFYHIQAPPGARVFFRVTLADFDRDDLFACAYKNLEINYSADYSKPGARVCSLAYPLPVSFSDRNELLVTYRGYFNSGFILQYRADFSRPVANNMKINADKPI